MIAWFRRWNSTEARLRRQLRRESYVYCEGDTATGYPPGIDFDICGRPDCEQPSGGCCRAAELERQAYEDKCRLWGIAP